MRAAILLLCAVPLCAANYDVELARAFGTQAGSAVVLDATTGKVLGGYHLDEARTRKAAPGSTLKPFTWLAWSEEHKGASIPRMVCRRKLSVRGRNLDCAHPDAGIPLGPQEAIAYSCNSFFDQLRFAAPPSFLQRFGLTSYAAQYMTLGAIGEEGIKVTPLELAQAYRVLALEARKGSLDSQVARGLQGSVEYGSGQLAGVKGLKVAGKTGTTTGPDGAYTHAWFAGWAPAEKPQIVVVVFLEQGRGAANAAPMAQAAFHVLEGGSGAPADSFSAGSGGATVRVSLYSELKPDSVTVNGKLVQAAELQKPVRVSMPVLSAPGAKSTRIPALVELSARGGHVQAVAEMRLEDYVYYTMSGESHSMRAREALRAMAIAARTFAVKNRGRHAAQGFDYCDSTHCQDLRFAEPPRAIAEAVEDTEAELVWFEGRLAEVFYHQHCGGVTASARAVWGARTAPYLVSQVDDACVARKRGAWSSDIPMAAAARALGVESVDKLRVTGRSQSGRADILQTGTRSINAGDFRFVLSRAFGWSTVPSTLFQISERGDTLHIEGYGSGHGVGMCQMGAEVRAERGASARQILGFYFPGTSVGVSAQGVPWTMMGGERVELWSTRPGEDKA
ncbi:MAG: SpoIID/LytB domain-containing protein, partial [Acidobacteriota bacterium]